MSTPDDTATRIAPVRLYDSADKMRGSGSMTMGVPDEDTPLVPTPDVRVPVHPRDMAPRPMPTGLASSEPELASSEPGSTELTKTEPETTKTTKAAEAAKEPTKTGDDLPF